MAKKQKFPEPTPLLDLAAARLVKRGTYFFIYLNCGAALTAALSSS